MPIRYAVSLWNYSHYAPTSLDGAIAAVREQAYGVELWGGWAEEGDLYYDDAGRKRIRPLVEGMDVSLHTAGAHTPERMKDHVDTAACVGAKIIVLHPEDLNRADDADRPDLERTKRAVDYAAKNGVTLALENGSFDFVCETVDKVDGLRFCLDVGHPYLGGDNEGDFLGALKHRLVHLHLQDVLPDDERSLPGVSWDHYTCGTGSIPTEDWQKLNAALREIDYDGMGVFEIMPRRPLQTALLTKRFLEGLFGT